MGWLIAAIASGLVGVGLLALAEFGHREARRIFAELQTQWPDQWAGSPEHQERQELIAGANQLQLVGALVVCLSVLLWLTWMIHV